MDEVSPQVPQPDPNRQLARMAHETTRENPWPLALLSTKMRDYINKMSELWVEAQIVEYRPRGATQMAFFKLRDLEEEVSITATAYAGQVRPLGEAFQEGARVVVRVKPTFWAKSGTLQLHAAEILIQGTGSLLEEIEKLRKRLAAEGLFSAPRKPLPFLPRRIGLICGRNAKAKEDVLVNAWKRWPRADFEIREVAVQGHDCVPQVCAALRELDAVPEIDVIVVTRGGGAVEDLLPFSDETMVRTAAQCQTPLVSAIGHEEDAPLLDLIADYRASTPTDAARRIVPDVEEQRAWVNEGASRLFGVVLRRLARERETIELLAGQSVLRAPTATLERHRQGLENVQVRLSAVVLRRLAREAGALESLASTLQAVSPEATLARGYAILRTPAKQVITGVDELQPKDLFEGILARGSFVGQVFSVNPNGSHN